MQRITPLELRHSIAIKLSVLKPFKQRELGIVNNSTFNEVLESVMSVLSGTVVIRPDFVSAKQRPGTFGVDEPHPFPQWADEPDGEQIRFF